MRALTVVEPALVRMESDYTPADDGDILVTPTLVGLCGTDLDIIDGRIDPAFVRYPVVLGHEWTGVVAQSDDPALPAGARVVVEGIVPCGQCRECARGATNRCLTYDEFGFTRAGAAADLVRAPGRLVHPLAAGVSEESAALVEPAAVVLRALQRAQPEPGETVLVVGDGTVALLVARLIQLWSPASVTMLGRRPTQARLAAAVGVSRFVTGSEPLGRHALVVEAAGAAEAVTAALAGVERGGRVVLLGFPGADVGVPVVVDDLVNGDVRVEGSFSYSRTAWADLVALLNAGRLDLADLVTHRFGADRWSDALEELRRPQGERGKVLLDMREGR